MTQDSLFTLRALHRTGARLLGRLESDAPFRLTEPAAMVSVVTARELHDGGWIEIDESAPIGDIYTFQISAAGKTLCDTL